MHPSFNKRTRGFLNLTVWSCVLIGMAALFPPEILATGEKEVSPEKQRKTPIHITSDRMVSDQNARWVEFIGNVEASQEGSVIHADSITLFYHEGGDETSEVVASQAIDKMVAHGQVTILFDNRTKTASADKAVYNAKDKVLVLTGGNPTVQSGQDVIRGEKITLYQSKNLAEVEGGEKKQVEATFYSNGEGGLIK